MLRSGLIKQPGPQRKMLLIVYAVALCARDCSGYPAEGSAQGLCGGVKAQARRKQLNVAFGEGCERSSARPLGEDVIDYLCCCTGSPQGIAADTPLRVFVWGLCGGV